MPFLLVPLLAHGVIEPLNWVIGLLLIVLGEAVRLSG
ncbi:MAG: hypothetical protein JWN53_934, partial [Gemmatimonadetes bacterium]|nr:hypothetical protein [Gemmatimonadota bacterium]